MKTKFPFLFLFLFFLPLLAFSEDPAADQAGEIVVNNRILATVNGKTISVIDVMKKMDIFLARSYPEYAKSNAHRYQFFTANWKDTLRQIIDNQLILADGEKLEIKIGDSEIRETIHERFGPNVMASLDKLGITLDEAWQMIYSEIAVQRMTGYRVYAKAMHKVGPQTIKKGYQDYLAKNPPKEEWKYQVLSIRATTEKLGHIYAQKAYAVIRNEPLPFEVLVEKMKAENLDPSVTIQVSEEYHVDGKDLSASHKAILCTLEPNTYSQPTPQVSRFDKTVVHRIFHLKEHIVTPPPSFDSMTEKLHDELVQKEIHQELPKYLSKLRKHFNFDETYLDNIPKDFQPFALR